MKLLRASSSKRLLLPATVADGCRPQLHHHHHHHHHHPLLHRDTEQLLRVMASVHPCRDGLPPPNTSPPIKPHKWFPSFRFLTACLLCLCFASVHMMNSNMGMAIVCMVETPAEYNASDIDGMVEGAAAKMAWTSEQVGYIFSAFNLGLLLMLGTGYLADRFNAKYMIMAAVSVACAANLSIPFLSPQSVYYAVAARFFVGLADALLQPAVNSLITRWFPAPERSYALGLATGGRQIGALLIVPASGALCSQTALFGGWPSIFIISAFVGAVFILFYTIVGADKPSKQSCISEAELKFITAANCVEDCGQKRTERQIPWSRILSSGPVWAAVIAVICHEFPLMTMIMFLPSYLRDVHAYSAAENGVLSALPTLSLWLAKLGSSYANTWLQKHTRWHKSKICKFLNGIGSLGLGVFLFATTLLDRHYAWLAVLFLCMSMACAGLHTPGCQVALVSVAPAYSGAITGLAFFFVACAGMFNPLLTKWITQEGTAEQWNLVFYISTVVAVLPCVTFTLFGSAKVQPWATMHKASTTTTVTTTTTVDQESYGGSMDLSDVD